VRRRKGEGIEGGGIERGGGNGGKRGGQGNIAEKVPGESV